MTKILSSSSSDGLSESRAKAFFTKKSNVLLLTLICTLLWGSAYPCVKLGYEWFAINTADPFSKLLYGGVRFVLAGVITLVFSVLLNKRLVFPDRKLWPKVAAIGLTQTFLEYLFYYIGLSNTTAVKGSVLYATSTFFIVILAHAFLKNDKLTIPKITGCVVGFLGIIITNLRPEGLELAFTLTGDGFMILASFFLACGNIISKTLPEGSDSASITGWQLLLGSILLVIIGIAGGGSFGAVSLRAVLLMLYMALLSSAAFTLWLLLLRYNPAGKIAVFNFLTPVFGSILSGIILGEAFINWQNLTALILVSIGIVIVNKRKNGSGHS